jgi:hypothetical protein
MNAHASRLNGLTRELAAKWLQTREQWKDARAEEFDQKYMQELQAGVDKTLIVMEELDKLLNKIRSDCE